MPTSGLVADVLDGPSVALYRLFDRTERLLYVGVTSDPRSRWACHKADKDWWPEVYRYSLEWLSGRQDALLEEARAIAAERPAYNIAGGRAERRPSRSATPGPLPADTLLSIRDVMSRYNISRQGLHNFRQRRDFPAPVPSAGSSRPRWRAGDLDAYFQANPKRQGARTDLQHA